MKEADQMFGAANNVNDGYRASPVPRVRTGIVEQTKETNQTANKPPEIIDTQEEKIEATPIKRKRGAPKIAEDALFEAWKKMIERNENGSYLTAVDVRSFRKNGQTSYSDKTYANRFGNGSFIVARNALNARLGIVTSRSSSRENEVLPQEWNEKNAPKLLTYYFLQLKPQLFAMLDSMRIDNKDREDILQTVFLKAFTRLDSFDGKNISAWLHRITRNASLDYIRHRDAIRMEGQSDHEKFETVVYYRQNEQYRRSEKSPETMQFQRESVGDILAAVRKLPDAERFMLAVDLLDTGKTQEQVGHILGMSRAAVKSYMFRRRETLRQLMPQELFDDIEAVAE